MRERTIIIAEAGVNHNGSIILAKKLIDVAAKAGVDYVKFQTFKTDNLVSKSAKKAEYQQINLSDEDNSQYSMLKKLELSEKQHVELIEYCQQKNIKFFSTAFDLESIDFLGELKLGLWKIPSGEITNFPYIRNIARYGEPVILSTGMSEIADIKNAILVLNQFGVTLDDITILHCNTEYPTPMKDVNLNAMTEMKKQFGVKIGYSDHTSGIEVPIAAVALGASVIEKHFTLDRTMEGPDHKASLEPAELEKMVSSIRNIELALGDKEKRISDSEKKNKSVARKSIVASKRIMSGEVFTEENLTVKRPGTGLSPMLWQQVLGQAAIRTFEEEEFIVLE